MNVKVQKDVNGDMYVIPSNAMKYLHAMVDILLYVSENVVKRWPIPFLHAILFDVNAGKKM